jgi:hypothetical protein
MSSEWKEEKKRTHRKKENNMCPPKIERCVSTQLVGPAGVRKISILLIATFWTKKAWRQHVPPDTHIAFNGSHNLPTLAAFSTRLPTIS